MREIEGGISAIDGLSACGIRRDRYGLALIACSGIAAGVFTRNKVRAAPIDLTSKNLAREGRLDGVIANSGCANAYTGARGLEDAGEMAGILAEILKTERSRIAVASTGVIGRYLDIDLLKALAEEAKGSFSETPQASQDAARAIMTTDTRIKEAAIEHGGIKVAGICKGAGMIEPNMATMLAFLYTDAKISREDLAESLAEAVDSSFNMLTVDGDTSTNDMVLITATGKQSCQKEVFKEALSHVCTTLARKMARDGEGASKYMETVVSGARTDMDARLAAKAVSRSNLVKTAIYGEDPNWGRIVCAIGRSGADFDPNDITLRLQGAGGEVTLVDRGRIVDGVLEEAERLMKGKEIYILIDLHSGEGHARSFGCDLTHEYIDINANYTT
ncbi:MAG: bifunctional ornithine acetyltransferase/N-acetylglutamate synthase [Methanotrichaceae archaeon]|nr:bifunctional ornithine acetyltransferase/N-acetylglutamate synthase [Methanotrichaceae archaeon]